MFKNLKRLLVPPGFWFGTYLSMIGILNYPYWEYLLILAWRGSIYRVYPCQEYLFIHDRHTYLYMLGILTYISMEGVNMSGFNNINMEFWFLASSFVGRNSVLVLYVLFGLFPNPRWPPSAILDLVSYPKMIFFDIEMTQR